jgi:hypothetical protein
MIRAEDLQDIQRLIARWERGDEVWSDPPLCAALVSEVRRLRRLLKDVYPLLVGTPVQEEVRSEFDGEPGFATPTPRRNARAARSSRPARGHPRLPSARV